MSARTPPPQPAWADMWEVIRHPADFAAALTAAHWDGPSIKVDDDDTYAPDHHRIMAAYKPGRIVLSKAKVYACDGTWLGRQGFLSGAVIPPGLTFRADEHGRIRNSVLTQAPYRTVDVGTVKTVCPSVWLWNDRPGWLDRIDCDHR